MFSLKSHLISLVFTFSFFVVNQAYSQTELTFDKYDLLNGLAKLNQKEQTDTSGVRFLIELADYYKFIDMDSAQYYIQKAATIDSLFPSDNRIKGDITYLFGALYYIKGLFDLAHYEFQIADNLYKEINFKVGIVKSSNGLALVHASWNEHEIANRYYKSALDLANELNFTKYKIFIPHNMGISYLSYNAHDSALYYFNISLKASIAENYTLNIIRNYMRIGESYFNIQNYDNAIFYSDKALTYSPDISEWDKGFTYTILADAFLQKGDIFKSIDYATKGVRIQKKLQAKWELIRLYKVLAQANEAKANYKESITYYKLYDSYKDSVFNEQKLNSSYRLELEKKNHENDKLQISAIETKAQVEYQKLWIAFLFITAISASVLVIVVYVNYKSNKKLNKELEQKNKALDELNHFKNDILSIVGHDMVNMVSSLGGFINLFNTKDISYNEFAAIAPLLEENIERMQLTLNNLFQWAASQKDGFKINKVSNSIPTLFTETKSLFVHICEREKINFQLDIQTNLPVEMDANHIRLVLRNLIHNAIKFTPSGGNITLYAKNTDSNKIEVGVMDTGVGIEEEVLKTLLTTINKRVSTTGTRNEMGTGLGLMASKNFLEQNNSQLRIESTPGEGSKFYFIL